MQEYNVRKLARGLATRNSRQAPIHGLARVRLQEPVSSQFMDRLHARPREFRNVVPADKILAQVRREPKREGHQQGHEQETANETAAPIKAQYIQPPCRHE